MTDVTTDKMIAQLRSILQLTHSEIQLAMVRQTQARTDAVRRELSENADNAKDRARRIEDALKSLGGAPDVVSPAVGKLVAVVKTGVEQGQPLHEALLGELTVEHQILDRVRFLKVLATAADETKVRRLAERLETAHSATVEWLTTVLAEDALGGPTALRRTPTQVLTGATVRLASFPVRALADRVNDAFAQARTERGKVSDTINSARQTVTDLRDGAVEVFGASRGAGLERAEKVAKRDGAP